MSIRPIIAAHGGCGDIPDSRVQAKLDGLRRSVRAGYAVLEGGEPQSEVTEAMAAVVAAVKVLEKEAAFNAGFGSVLNEDGQVEMDAVVVEGKTLDTGAVAGIVNVPHPTEVALKVMTSTPHCLIVGEGANRFASKMGFEALEPEKLVSPDAIRALERFRRQENVTNEIGHEDEEEVDKKIRGTVGAVAMDRFGNLAAATSTGGLTGKMLGRVGDSPIVGAGVFADNRKGAVSTTGLGECLLKTMVARMMIDNLQKTEDVSKAIKMAADEMTDRVGGDAGAVMVTPDGRIGVEWNSRRMGWASVDAEGKVHSGCNKGEDFVEPFK